MMGDKKGETTTIKKQQPPQSEQQQSSSPKDPLDESTSSDQVIIRPTPLLHHAPPTLVVAGTTPSFISTPAFVPVAATSTSSSFDPPTTSPSVNTKRPRYGGTAQWKLLPSPSSQQKLITTESTPSPTTNIQTQQQITVAAAAAATAASSSDTTTSSPSHSPLLTTASGGKETSMSLGEGGDHNNPLQLHHQNLHQFRKGKYVSPVWKPNEMLWLARAWRVQYQGTGGSSSDAESGGGGYISAVGESTATTTRGKTRADKDREVAEYLNRHGVSRDAKTAGTKWDNMLGEFRKVYEWERGGERDQVGKSYFRLSPYERKIHRLPASFDEEVFEELSQFMGSRMRSSSSSHHHHHHSQSRGILNIISSAAAPSSGDNIVEHSSSRTVLARSLPPPPPLLPPREDDLVPISGRAKQLVMAAATGSGDQGYNFHGGGRGSFVGFDPTSSILMEHNMNSSNNNNNNVNSLVLVGASSNASPNVKEMRRIGKIRMTWEESVSLWGEEGEHHRGRVKLQGSSFLNADELTFFDDSMVACTMEAFEDGVFKGFSVDKFVSGQQLKVFGRRKSSTSTATATAMATTTSTPLTSTTPPPPPSSASGFIERVQLPLTDQPSMRSIPPVEFQDPTEYYVGCLRVPPTALPTLFELSWYLQEPPPEELRFPLRRDVYRDLPQGKDFFFTTSNELLDCRGITYDLLSPIIRPNPSITGATSSSRDSFISVWDDCINRVVSKFCSVEVVLVRKPTILTAPDGISTTLQDQWPNVSGFVRNFCLWRGEETDASREGEVDPSSSIVEKLLWTYMDLPYILGYYAVGHLITFCALSRSQDRIHRSDLYSLDLSSPSERLKALVPCYRIAGLLPLLADRCFNNVNSASTKQLTFSDFERVDLGYGNVVEMTPNTVTRFYSGKRRWTAVKEIYDVFD